MAKLPDRTELGTRDPRASRSVPSYPTTSPVAAALQGLGQTGMRVASSMLAERQEEQDREIRFGANTRYVEFGDRWRQTLTERERTTAPGAAGFTDSLRADYATSAREFLKSVPDELKAEYDQKLFSLESGLAESADRFANSEHDRHTVSVGSEAETRLLGRLTGDLTKDAAVLAEGEQVWNSAPIPPSQREVRRQAWAETYRQKQGEAVVSMLNRLTDEAVGLPSDEERERQIVQGEAMIDQAIAAGHFDAGYGAELKRDFGQGLVLRAVEMRPAEERARLGGGGGGGRAAMRDFIADAEGTDKGAGYNETLSYGAFTGGPRDLVSMTLDEVDAMQTDMLRHPDNKFNSSASGRYQIVQKTLRGLRKELGLTGTEKFTPELQDRLADALIERRGNDVAGLRNEWEGLRRRSSEEITTAMSGQGGGNAAGADSLATRIPADKRQKIADEATRELQTKRDREQRLYLAGADDAAAFLRAGNDLPADSPYTPERLRVNLDPETAAVVEKEMNAAEAYGSDADALRFASRAEVDAIKARRKELLASPEGFRAKAQDMAGLNAALEARNKQLVEDPAAYVVQDPAVQESFSALSAAEADQGIAPEQKRQAARLYAETSLAMQERMGLPAEATRVLPKAVAAGIGSQFRSLLTMRKDANQITDGAQQAAGFMRSQESQWGPLWPRVFGELVADKALPGPAMVMGTMGNPDQHPAAEQLGQAVIAGKDALETGRPSEDLKELRESLSETFAPLAATLAHDTARGNGTYQTFEEAGYLLALSYMRQGDDAASAAERAYSDILGKKYEMRGTLRIPNTVDADMVEDRADEILERLDPATLLLPPVEPGMTPESTGQAVARSVQSFGFWVANPDESGIMLMSPMTRTGRFANPSPVLDKDGRPVSFTWGELQRRDKASRAEQKAVLDSTADPTFTPAMPGLGVPAKGDPLDYAPQ